MMRILLFLIAADFAVFQSCNNTRESIQTDWINVSSACFCSCTFQNTFCSYSQGCRDPQATEWVRDSDSTIMHGYNDVADSYSTLESPLIAIPETSCLTIDAFCNSPSSVAILLSNNSDNAFKLVETIHGHTTNLLRDFSLEPATFRILIQGRSGGNANGYVQLRYVRLERGRCGGHGREPYSCDSSSTAMTTAASSIYSFTTTSGTKVPSVASPTWQTSEFSGFSVFSQKSSTFTSLTSFSYISDHSSSPSSAENHNQDDYGTNVAAIVGSIVSLAIVFLLIIIFAVLWRRRKCHHKRKDEDDDLEFQKQHPGFIINTERKVTNTVSVFNADGNQHNVFRKGGSVLKTESSNSTIMETKGKHTIMNTEDSNKHTYDLIPGDTNSEMFPDDSVGKFNCKAETVSNDPLTSPNNGNEFPTSTLNRDDKGNNARNLGQNEQLNCPDVYSKINKTVKKPVANEVYNRLDALKPKVGNSTEDTVMNTYNNGTINSSQNEYNVLNFQQMKCNNVADARNEPSDNCDSKLNIYSSVDIHTDTYSRVQNDKKERVITSDYDHIR